MDRNTCGPTTLAMVLYCDQIGLFQHSLKHAKSSGYEDAVIVLIGESMLDAIPLPVGICPDSIRSQAFSDQDADGCPRFVPFILPFEDLVAWAAVTGNESDALRLKNYPGLPVYVVNDEGGTFLSFSPSLRVHNEHA
jgi:hypothetical protein